MRTLTLALPILAALTAAGCGEKKPDPAPGPAPVTPAPSPIGPAPAPAPGGTARSPQGPMHFEEIGEKAGLKFHMTFLRPEQGENFKINLYDHGCGVAVADINGDGKDDLYILNQLGANGMFRNKGDGTFDDVTTASGTALDKVISVAAVFGDVDSDGDQDLYVTTTRGGNVLFRNDGKGVFTDVTAASGLTHVGHSMSPVFFDADGDGDLDLFVTSTASWTLDTFDTAMSYYRGKGALQELINSAKETNLFYLNDGNGKFTDISEESGLAGLGWGGDVAVFDRDSDGDLDVFVCNMFGRSQLYDNEGKGRFRDVTQQALGITSWGAVGARAFDYDGDARLDLYVVDMHSDMWMPFDIDPLLIEEDRKYRTFFARAVALRMSTMEDDRKFAIDAAIPEKGVVFGNTLYRATGKGAFEETSDDARAETWWPWGIAEGDFDGDGHVDAYIPSGMGHPLFYWRNPMLRNKGDGSFEDVCRTAGLDPPPGGKELDIVLNGKKANRSSRAAAVGDFDGDGRLDLIVNNFNDRPFLFRNTSKPSRWVGFRLKGTRRHPDAVGALVKVTAGGRTQVRQVQAAGGYLTQSSLAVHFGLGESAAIESVEIVWPGGQVQKLEGAKIDAWQNVVEPR